MTAAQKAAVIALYGELCKKFKLTPSTSTIRPHCWFTASGTYLGKYDASKSAKTCPGTAFWGVGCSITGFAKFITDVKNYVNGNISSTTTFKQYIARCTTDNLNCRKGPGTNYAVERQIDKGVAITIIEKKKASDGGTWCKAKSGYWVNKKYLEFVKYV